MNNVVQVELFDSAEALLERLSARHPSWVDQPQAWAFRGHADASWSLIPSALRATHELFAEDETATGARLKSRAAARLGFAVDLGSLKNCSWSARDSAEMVVISHKRTSGQRRVSPSENHRCDPVSAFA